MSAGGMLVGPSHDNGGIQAIVDGTEPIEVEGGEFIINKQTVDAVGEEFLHKLNSTETTHHTGGYDSGQLPSPSKFKDGGRVTNKKPKKTFSKKMRRGGSTKTYIRKFGHGGMTAPGLKKGRNIKSKKPTPRRVKKSILRAGGSTNQVALGRTNTNYRRGNVVENQTFIKCSDWTSDVTTCNSMDGCYYDYGREKCSGR